MLKLLISSLFLMTSGVAAQGFVDYTKCVGLHHGAQVGVGHRFSCTKYYFCSQGIGILEDCAEIYGDMRIAFNEETGFCGFNVACRQPEPVTTTIQPITVPPSSSRFNLETDDNVQCPMNRPGEIFLLPSSNCSQFFICSNGARMLMSCIQGLLFNEDNNQCDLPNFSRCASRQSGISDDGLTVRCNNNGHYNTGFHRDCTKYVMCLKGIPNLKKCPIGFAWNEKHCVERKYAQCPELIRRMEVF